jgi:hypothetical protein
MTPAVMDRAFWSASCPPSSEVTDARFVRRDDFDPLRLGALRLGAVKPPNPPLRSSLLSELLSLCSFLPKNERPPDDCLDALSLIEGIVVQRTG